MSLNKKINNFSDSFVDAILEATDNGILIIDLNRKVVKHNARFIELWKIPSELQSSDQDEELLSFAANQLLNSGQFIDKVIELYDQPEAQSFDTISFKDGRVFERFSRPMYFEHEVIARVWSFRDITITENIKRELSKEVGFRKTIVQTLPDLVWLKDTQGVYLTCNERFEDFFGACETEIIGKTDYDFVDKELADFFREHDKQAMIKDAPSVNDEWITFANDGHREFLETTKTPMYNDKKELIGVLGIGHDVTHRIKSVDMINTIVQTAPLRIFWKDKNLNYLGCNDLFAKDAGFENSYELIGKNDFDMGWKDQAELYRADDFRVMESGNATLGYEEPQTTPDGKQIWLRTSKVPLIDTVTGETIGILGVYDDITSQRQASERLKYALDGASDGLWDWNMQTNDVFYSPRWLEMLGYQYGELPQRLETWSKLVRFEDEKEALSMVSDYLEGRVDKFEIELRMKHKDGHWIDVLSRARLAEDEEGNILEPRHLVGTHVDITERKKMEHELRQKDIYHRALLDNFPFLVWLKDTNGNFLSVNRPFVLATGLENAEQIVGATDFDIWPKDLAQAYVADDNKVLQNRIAVEREEELSDQGVRKWIETYKAPIIDDEGIIFGTVGFARDISERKEMQLKLQYIAHYDTLTNLPNRLLFSDRLQQALSQSKRRNSIVSVIYLDLDGFKEVNDTHGHQVGDKLLVTLSGRLKLALREGDTLSRLGGDEFVIILQDLSNMSEVKPVLERLLLGASAPIMIDNVSIQVSASIGVTFYPQEEEIDADQLVRQSDQAMYQAKQLGKNRYRIFDSNLDRSVRTHHESLERIRKALKDEEFILYYQPKVNMRSGEVIGAEALIRWQHPEKGIMAPGAFLPDIENNVLMIELGDWVLESAMKQIELWHTQGIYINLSVNIDSLQLQQSDFVEKVESLLQKYPDVKSGELEFEILETSALNEISYVAEIITKCHDLGIEFALDDFGTGYSSLMYLKRLRANRLKIDQSFVFGLLDDPEDLAIIEGITELANTFKKELIAEGVESITHGSLLLLMGCEEAQGYAIAKPMEANAIVKWLGSWHPPFEWINQITYEKDNSFIAYAIAEHREWVKKIIDYLTHKKDTQIPRVDFKQCNFGKILGENSIKTLTGTELHTSISSTHKEIHMLAKTLIELTLNGQTESIKTKIEQLKSMSDAIVKQLMQSILKETKVEINYTN